MIPGKSVADALLSARMLVGRITHSAFVAGVDHRLHKARFAHPHELHPLLGRAEPEFGTSLHIGVGPYDRVLRVRATDTRREIGNVLVSAPPRGGKSLGAVTDLLTWNGSVVVNDIKGELLAKTGGFRAGFSKVVVVDSRGVGHRYDPLHTARTEEDYRAMAMHLLQGPGQKDTDAFLIRAVNMQVAIFQAAALEEIVLFPYSANLLHLGPEAVAARLHALSLRFGLAEGNNLATRFLDRPIEHADISDRYFQSAWSTLTATAAAINTETVIKCLSGADFTAEEILLSTAEEKPARMAV